MNPHSRDQQTGSVHGHLPEEVFRLIAHRRTLQSDGVPSDDGFKLGLVVEGGGMRAAGSAGAVVELAELDCVDVFDSVYATSAGVMNAAYFLSGQHQMGITIYFDDLTKRQFINRFRFWRIMDLDWVFREVIQHSKPLDVTSMLDSRPEFHVAATDFDSGERTLINVKEPTVNPLAALKGAMAIPVLYNKAVEVDGARLFDGGLLNPFPIADAIDAGCTHILVLLSRGASYQRDATHPLMSMLFDWYFARGAKCLRGMFRRYPELDRAARDLAFARKRLPDGVHIATICPPSDCPLQRSTVDKERLIAASRLFGKEIKHSLAKMCES